MSQAASRTREKDLKPIRFTADEARLATDAWGFNCGPGTLCAVLGMTPAEIRPHLGDFERKRYTNPSLMAEILHGLHVPFRRVYECLGARAGRDATYPWFGLVRVQWAGPWTREGVPVRARYRHTHWIGIRHYLDNERGSLHRQAFDVNATCSGGWLLWARWELMLVPWLLHQCEPKANHDWWPTHGWELRPEEQAESDTT